MRRTEFQQRDQKVIDAFLDSMGHGFLAFVRPDLSPGIVAVNFVRLGATVYFHGSPEGEKMTALASRPTVAIMVADALSLIPSHFFGGDLACPASQFHRAVVIRGRARIVEDLAEKASALQALMEKLQPEGGHLPVSEANPRYRKQLRNTAVVAIPMEEVTARFKLGQNLPRARRASIARQLAERDGPRDHDTARAMALARPFA